jgi:hypothetical protein
VLWVPVRTARTGIRHGKLPTGEEARIS